MEVDPVLKMDETFYKQAVSIAGCIYVDQVDKKNWGMGTYFRFKGVWGERWREEGGGLNNVKDIIVRLWVFVL